MESIKDIFTAFYQTLEGQFTVKIIVCLIIGYIIGKERALKGKNAGIGTFSLVITGSMLFTQLSELVDPASTSRIAAQIVTGIWFLWAGLIMHDGGNVRNLTTAAGIRFAWAIGMTVGFGFYGIAIISTAVAAMAPRTSDKSFWSRKKAAIKQKSHDNKNNNNDEEDDNDDEDDE
jgi:putative Mg2+ transporter-C (MgtC) family protein